MPPHWPAASPGPITDPALAAAAQRSALVRLVRMAFVVMMMTVVILYVLNAGGTQRTGETAFGFTLAYGWHIPFTAGVLLCLSVLAIDLLTPRKKIATISGVFFGLIVGLIATFAMNFVIDLLVDAYEIKAPDLIATIKVLIGMSLCYLGMSTVAQTQDDFRLVIPYVEFAKQLRGAKPLLLDSSALIDARIADLAATGLFQTPLVIPRFVIGELQTLADSSDKSKRLRGRRGLDVVSRLQRAGTLDVTIDETPVPGKAVDQMLVELARATSGIITTTDTGLARVAAIHGVLTLNLNDIALALKPALIPGTQLLLHLMKPGEQPGQAVGYLDDGTMVVVERAEDRLGEDAPVEVTSTLQTSAGRLIFARLTDAATLPRADASFRDGLTEKEEEQDNAGAEEPDADQEADGRHAPDTEDDTSSSSEHPAPPAGPPAPLGTPLAPPLTVKPPLGAPDRPGTHPRAKKNPWRNPRR